MYQAFSGTSVCRRKLKKRNHGAEALRQCAFYKNNKVYMVGHDYPVCDSTLPVLLLYRAYCLSYTASGIAEIYELLEGITVYLAQPRSVGFYIHRNHIVAAACIVMPERTPVMVVAHTAVPYWQVIAVKHS